MNDRSQTIHRFESVSATLQAAADAVVQTHWQSVEKRGRFLFVLSGGSTPKGLYHLLAQSKKRKELDWARVEFFWGDERPVSPDHPDSNYGMAAEALLRPLQIPQRQVHRIRGEAEELGRAAADYQEEIAAVCKTAAESPPPAFDLVLLGMGSDGHTASLFPYTPALYETRRWVVSNPHPQLGNARITLTPPILNQARQIFFLVVGTEKRTTLTEVLEGPYYPERLPCQLIRPRSGNVAWFVDSAAAADLSAEVGQDSLNGCSPGSS